MRNIIKTIINLAVNAPSGDNSQPWEFEFVNDSSLNIYNLTKADNEIYNFKQRGSYLAHGALIQNILILAEKNGLGTKLTYFPSPEEKNLTCNLIFFKQQPKNSNKLSDYINKRHTNRKPYLKKPLPEKFYDSINSAQKDFNVKLRVITDPDSINEIADTISLNEKLILENRAIHEQIFKFIRWSKKEEEQLQNGLYIKTLELNPAQEKAFKLFRNWKIINFLNIFHFANLVAKDTKKLYKKTECFGLLTIPNYEPASFLNSGRYLELIWLSATEYGISLQPTTALLYLQQRISEGEKSEFSRNQIKDIDLAVSKLKTIFNVQDGEKPAMLFRMGYSEPPSAISIKRHALIRNEK